MAIRGIKNGAVIQRNEKNVCDFTVFSDKILDSIKVSCKYSKPEIENVGNGKYRITGIYCGGPYSVTLGDETFNDIYVGDVWLLTGQSNMQGVGRLVNIGKNENQSIRALYLQNEWNVANHPLHQLTKSYYNVHTNFCHSTDVAPHTMVGAGPGLSFAEKMFDLTHVPQGIIACGHGGTNLFNQWSPKRLNEGGDSLYGATHERYLDTGSNVAGVFWYQGCSDAHAEYAPKYTENMIELVNSFRSDFQPNLPFVQVQIGCCSWSEIDNRESIKSWSSIREQQRLLNDKIDNFDTVHTVAHRLADCIHLSADSQKIVGMDAAEAMYCLKFGKLYGCLPGIKLRKMEVIKDEFYNFMTHIILTYDNVHGELSGGYHALGFDTSSSKEVAEHCGILDIKTDGCRVILDTTFNMEDIQKRYLWYNFGREPICNIVDSSNRSLPGFGPLKIENAEYC